MEFDVTCSKKREEKGKKTREKERWGKMLKFPWKGYEWKGKRRGWTWIGGQGIWFPWKVIDSMEFDVTCWNKRREGKEDERERKMRENAKIPVEGIWMKGEKTRMNLNWRTRHLIPVKLSLLKNVRWNSIAYESVWNHMDECASSRETVSMVKGQRRQGRALAHKALHPRVLGDELSPWA